MSGQRRSRPRTVFSGLVVGRVRVAGEPDAPARPARSAVAPLARPVGFPTAPAPDAGAAAWRRFRRLSRLRWAVLAAEAARFASLVAEEDDRAADQDDETLDPLRGITADCRPLAAAWAALHEVTPSCQAVILHGDGVRTADHLCDHPEPAHVEGLCLLCVSALSFEPDFTANPAYAGLPILAAHRWSA